MMKKEGNINFYNVFIEFYKFSVTVKKRILNDREVFKDVIKKVDYIIVNKDLNETVNEIVSILEKYKV